MRALRALLVCGVFATAALASAQSKYVGIWKPGVQIPAGKLTKSQTQLVNSAKQAAMEGSMKLNKDKTFGAKLGKVMFGNWSVRGNILTISVTSIVGMSDKQVKALSEKERVAKFRIEKNGMLTTLPLEKGKPTLVWKKQRAMK